MATQKYWIWLAQRSQTAAGAGRVLEHFGTPEAAYFSDPEELCLIPGLSAQAKNGLRDKSLTEAEDILACCDRLGVRILTLGDAEYPDRLKNIYDAPAVLYIKGKLFRFDDEAAVGVVGSRAPSAYGVKMAGRLGLELARGGALVVSGIAQGIDSAALRGALRGGGGVVSVLGCGVDVVYPKENKGLFEDVAAAGALISEYPPGTQVRGEHFPVRNRIISGLSLGVVAVEGALKSGTLITAGLALDQNRDVFAVPGPVDAPMSAGTNQLIKNSAARLVESGADILMEYIDRFPQKLCRRAPFSPEEEAARLEGLPLAPPEKKPAARANGQTASDKKEVDNGKSVEYIDWKNHRDKLTDDQRDLLLALAGGTKSADELIELTQIPARRVLSALTMLQIGDYVREEPGKRFTGRVILNID